MMCTILSDFSVSALDQDEETDVALIGVGSLGNAFLKYNFQKNHNTRIVVAFDPKAPKEGKMMSGIPVFHPDMMEEKIKELGIDLVILRYHHGCARSDGSACRHRHERDLEFHSGPTVST